MSGPDRDAAIRTASTVLATLRQANATQDGPEQDALVASAGAEAVKLAAHLVPAKGKAKEAGEAKGDRP